MKAWEVVYDIASHFAAVQSTLVAFESEKLTIAFANFRNFLMFYELEVTNKVFGCNLCESDTNDDIINDLVTLA